MYGLIWRSNRGLDSRNSTSKGLPSGSFSRPPSRLQPASASSFEARDSSARSWPEPSDTGGMNGSPNTSSDTFPRHGSSSASSSGVGLPLASMSEFWK